MSADMIAAADRFDDVLGARRGSGLASEPLLSENLEVARAELQRLAPWPWRENDGEAAWGALARLHGRIGRDAFSGRCAQTAPARRPLEQLLAVCCVRELANCSRDHKGAVGVLMQAASIERPERLKLFADVWLPELAGEFARSYLSAERAPDAHRRAALARLLWRERLPALLAQRTLRLSAVADRLVVLGLEHREELFGQGLSSPFGRAAWARAQTLGAGDWAAIYRAALSAPTELFDTGRGDPEADINARREVISAALAARLRERRGQGPR